MPSGVWRSPNYRQPDMGAPGRLYMTPAEKQVIRRYRRDGVVHGLSIGEASAIRAIELEVECAMHDGPFRTGTICTCPDPEPETVEIVKIAEEPEPEIEDWLRVVENAIAELRSLVEDWP